MIRLVLDNKSVTVRGKLDRCTLRLLEASTSYLIQGYRFVPAFRHRYWDGRTRLMELNEEGQYVAPIGLLGDITRALDEEKIHYEIKRKKQHKRELIHYEWNEKIVPRAYQLAAVEAFLSSPNKGRGILKMPIRSGKTKTAARVIWALQAKTLFLVPSQMLLNQTVEALRESLPGADVGKIGDGNWNEGDITVATIQSLLSARGGKQKTCKGNLRSDEDCACGKTKCKGGRKYLTPKNKVYDDFMNSHDFVICDELHHLTGDAWRNVFLDSNAKYRLGLSATVYFDMAREVERGVLWLKACCGDIKYEVGVSDLIEQGYLMRQNVKIFKVEEPKTLAAKNTWSQAILREGIWANEHRNDMIVKLAEKAIKFDNYTNVMIATNRIEQVEALDALLDHYGIDHAIITGSTPSERRQEIVDSFKRNEISVLLGTVFGEGIDIPEVECVINAEGGRDAKKTVQRMRNMTMSEGKTKVLMIDFYDTFNSYLKTHSNARMKTYKEEKAFVVDKMY